MLARVSLRLAIIGFATTLFVGGLRIAIAAGSTECENTGSGQPCANQGCPAGTSCTKDSDGCCCCLPDGKGSCKKPC